MIRDLFALSYVDSCYWFDLANDLDDTLFSTTVHIMFIFGSDVVQVCGVIVLKALFLYHPITNVNTAIIVGFFYPNYLSSLTIDLVYYDCFFVLYCKN